MLYITTSYLTSSKKISVFVVVALNSILSTLQYRGILVKPINKIILAKILIVC